MLDEISRLDPFKFQELWSVLLQEEFPRFRAVDGRGGDEGVDAWIPESRVFFQFHAPRARVQRAKVNAYLQQAARHKPAKWIFATNQGFTRTQWCWFDALSKTVAFEIDVWDATKLAERLGKRPDLCELYLSALAPRSRSIRVQTQRAGSIVNVAADTVQINARGTKRPRLYVPGVVATDPVKHGYLKYLVKIYIDFKRWDVGKSGQQMTYPLIYNAYRREMKYSISETPLEKFGQACEYLQMRIQKTRIGRTKNNQKLFDTFEEFAASTPRPRRRKSAVAGS